MKNLFAPTLLLVVLLAPTAVRAQDRNTKVRNDRARVEAREDWVYNDLAAARAEAEKTGKPLLAVIRCIP